MKINNKFNIGDKVQLYKKVKEYREYVCPFCEGKGVKPHPMVNGEYLECTFCWGNNIKEISGYHKELNKEIYIVDAIGIWVEKDRVEIKYTLKNEHTTILSEKEENIRLKLED